MSRAITKSSRHSKIIGELGEHIIANYLSTSGFEVVMVDHTGIDIIAVHPKTKLRMGITVKSRTRLEGKENQEVFIFTKKEKLTWFKNICEMFDCEPWIGIFVETTDKSDIYLVSLSEFERIMDMNKKTIAWKMNDFWRKHNDLNDKVKHIHLSLNRDRWIW